MTPSRDLECSDILPETFHDWWDMRTISLIQERKLNRASKDGPALSRVKFFKMVVRESPTSELHGMMVSKSDFCIPTVELLNHCEWRVRIYILKKPRICNSTYTDFCKSGGSRTWASLGSTWRAHKTQMAEFLIQWFWGRAWESAFLMSSWVIVMLLV